MISSKKSLLIHEALLVILIPLVGYAISFLYEIGYCSTFNIPLYFINPSPTTIFIGISSIGGFLLLFVVIRWFLENFLGTGPVGFGIRRFTGFFLVIAYTIALFGADWKRLGAILITLVGFIFIQFGVPLFTQSKHPTYRDKLEAEDKGEWEFDKFRKNIIKYFGPGLMQLLVFLFFISWAAYITGVAHAEQQREFLVIETEPQLVVLRDYANEFICGRFDETTKELLNVFSFLNRDNLDQNVFFKLKKVGPLKPVELE